MELNIKVDEKMIAEVANRVLDEFEYNGKTIREWADLITNPKTNADRIRAMTDEKLAEWINKHDCHTNLYGYDPKEAILDWLKQEAE